MSVLDLLTGDAARFAGATWGRTSHLHDVGSDLADLLTLADVDRLVTTTGVRAPALRLVRDGSVLSTSSWTRGASLAGARITGLADVRRVVDLVGDGATLVLQGLQRWHPPITRAVASLEDELGHPVQANAYLTPPGARGFDPHADRHDVFVCQTHGSKAWTIHDGGPDGDQPRDLDLAAGACLYLPAGTTHAAASQDEVSLHVTIGVKATPWRELVRRAMDMALDDVAPPIRDHGPRLPVDPGAHPDDVAAVARDHLQRAAAALAATDVDNLLEAHETRFATTRTVTWPGLLADRLDLDDMDDDTLVERRNTVLARVRVDDRRAHLLIGDRRLSMPRWVAPALEHLVDLDRLRPRDLADLLDETSRLVLVRRLVREGLFAIVR